jgi:hypothetical protein
MSKHQPRRNRNLSAIFRTNIFGDSNLEQYLASTQTSNLKYLISNSIKNPKNFMNKQPTFSYANEKSIIKDHSLCKCKQSIRTCSRDYKNSFFSRTPKRKTSMLEQQTNDEPKNGCVQSIFNYPMSNLLRLSHCSIEIFIMSVLRRPSKISDLSPLFWAMFRLQFQ